MRGSPQENFETSLIIADKREVKMEKDRYPREVEYRGIEDLGEQRNGRSANPFVNGADRIEKKISELRRRVHARRSKKMTAADRERRRLLYFIQLLFRLDRINFKKRFEERFSRRTNWSRHPCKELNTFFSLWEIKKKSQVCVRDILLSAIFYLKEGPSPPKEMEVDKTLDWIGWPTRCAGAHSDTPDYSPRAVSLESEYCEGRIPDVIHYSAEAWRSGKSRDFHRRASMRGAQLPLPPPCRPCTYLSRRFPSSKGGNLPRFPRSEDFLSISRPDRKAHSAARGDIPTPVGAHRTVGSYSISSIRHATAIPRHASIPMNIPWKNS